MSVDMAKSFKPMRTLVLLHREIPVAEAGGIIIPEMWRQYGWRGTVIRSGPMAPGYAKGDVILFLKEFTILPFNDRTLALTDAKHILAKIVVGNETERIVPQNSFCMVSCHDQEPAKHDIVIVKKITTEHAIYGTIIKIGPKCKNVELGQKIVLTAKNTVNCCEDDTYYKMIDEKDIIAENIL